MTSPSAGCPATGRAPARLLAAAAAAVALLAAAGCGERTQMLEPQGKTGKYQGKADSRPWDNAPTAYGASRWEKGDQASWENAIRTRNQRQNEYVRAQ